MVLLLVHMHDRIYLDKKTINHSCKEWMVIISPLWYLPFSKHHPAAVEHKYRTTYSCAICIKFPQLSPSLGSSSLYCS
jgi:predicted SprT family Zn-dependent metalloprotease